MNNDFYLAFRDNTSGVFRECGCGKSHFDLNYQYDEEVHKDIDRWSELEESTPDQYQSHDGSISAVVISGVEYVPDCTCRRIETIQEIVDKNAIQIAEYLRAKSKKLKELSEAVNV